MSALFSALYQQQHSRVVPHRNGSVGIRLGALAKWCPVPRVPPSAVHGLPYVVKQRNAVILGMTFFLHVRGSLRGDGMCVHSQIAALTGAAIGHRFQCSCGTAQGVYFFPSIEEWVEIGQDWASLD
jgi:hypothetical protein